MEILLKTVDGLIVKPVCVGADWTIGNLISHYTDLIEIDKNNIILTFRGHVLSDHDKLLLDYDIGSDDILYVILKKDPSAPIAISDSVEIGMEVHENENASLGDIGDNNDGDNNDGDNNDGDNYNFDCFKSWIIKIVCCNLDIHWKNPAPGYCLWDILFGRDIKNDMDDRKKAYTLFFGIIPVSVMIALSIGLAAVSTEDVWLPSAIFIAVFTILMLLYLITCCGVDRRINNQYRAIFTYCGTLVIVGATAGLISAHLCQLYWYYTGLPIYRGIEVDKPVYISPTEPSKLFFADNPHIYSDWMVLQRDGDNFYCILPVLYNYPNASIAKENVYYFAVSTTEDCCEKSRCENFKQGFFGYRPFEWGSSEDSQNLRFADKFKRRSIEYSWPLNVQSPLLFFELDGYVEYEDYLDRLILAIALICALNPIFWWIYGFLLNCHSLFEFRED